VSPGRLFFLDQNEKQRAWMGNLFLPALEEEVFGDSLMDIPIEESFSVGLNEWWPDFIVGDCL
jgi:hypothetical protein